MEPETTLRTAMTSVMARSASWRHRGHLWVWARRIFKSHRCSTRAGGLSLDADQDGVRLGDVMSPGGAARLEHLAAFGSAMAFGVKFDDLAKALPGFLGTRRQEEKGEVGGVLVMDDYAHHPIAIRETLAGFASKPDRRIWGIYEPKSNTARRNIHQAAYATAFDSAESFYWQNPTSRKTA